MAMPHPSPAPRRGPRPPRRDARPDGPRGTGQPPRPRSGARGESAYERPARGARPNTRRETVAGEAGASRWPTSRDTANRTRRARPVDPEVEERQRIGALGRARGWGGVARKGAVNISSTGRSLDDARGNRERPEPPPAWIEDERPRGDTSSAPVAARAAFVLPSDVAANVRKAFIGSAYMREKTVATLAKAAEAYDRKRYEEALRLGRTVADLTPGVAAVRELTGLAAYRGERWNMAKIHLRAHFTLTGNPEHLPLVMDCDRAHRRYRAVERTFEELTESEPTADVLTEGRIVMAGALADQRQFHQAIDLLVRAGGTKQLRNPSYRHVRLWYALADIFDRAGDAGSARELFARVVLAEPDAYDAQARLLELGLDAPRKTRRRRTTPVSKKRVD